VQILAVSADPYLRGQIRSDGSIKAGNPMFGFVSGKILESKKEGWIAGDLFGANLPFSTFQIVTAE
jgi:NADPH-dependent curcumin reductase CurA